MAKNFEKNNDLAELQNILKKKEQHIEKQRELQEELKKIEKNLDEQEIDLPESTAKKTSPKKPTQRTEIKEQKKPEIKKNTTNETGSVRIYPPEYTNTTHGRNMAYIPDERLVQEIRTTNNKKDIKSKKEQAWREQVKERREEENKQKENEKISSAHLLTQKEVGTEKEELKGKIRRHDYAMISEEDLDTSRFEKVDTDKLKHKPEKSKEYKPSKEYREHKKRGEGVTERFTDTVFGDYKNREEEESAKPTGLNDAQKNAFLEKMTRAGFNYDQLKNTDINTLTFGKRMLLLETLEQQLLDKVKRGAKESFEKEIRESGKISRIWKNVRKGYNIAQKEKEFIAKHKEESLIDKNTTTALIETISGIKAPITYSDGKIEIKYISETGNDGKESVFAKDFNNAANIFARIPAEWQFSANKKERAQYQEAKESFDQTRSVLITSFPEEKRGEAMEQSHHTTGNILMLQHMMTHPEAGAALTRAETSKAWKLGIDSYYKENASFMALGMASRQAIVGTSIATLSTGVAFASALAAPITGGIVGWFRAKDRAKKDLTERDVNARKGIHKDNREHIQKKMIAADEIDNIFDYLITKIHTTTDLEKKKRLLASLETRTTFITKELKLGNVAFGGTELKLLKNLTPGEIQKTGNTDADRIRRYMSVTQKLAEAQVIVQSFTKDLDDLKHIEKIAEAIVEQNIKNQDIKKEREKEIIQKMKEGALIGASFGAAGWLARHMLPDVDLGISEKVGELYRNAKSSVQDFFGEQGIKTPRTDIEIKNISMEQDNTEKLSVIDKGVPTTEVTVSSKGFIKTIEELQKTFLKEHPTEELPDSLKGNPTEVAQKLGLYNPEGSKSGMVIGNKDTTLGINEQGDIVLHDATKNTDTILSAKNTFKGSFIETGKVNISTQEDMRTDYTESSHGEKTEIESVENTTPVGEEEIDAVRFFKLNPLTYEVASHYAGDDSIGDIREKDPQLFKYLEDLRKKSGLEYNGDDDSATNYVERAMKKIEGMESSDTEHVETNPSKEATVEEDTYSEDVEGDVSPEEETTKTPTQKPEEILAEPLDTLKATGDMSSKQVSQMIEVRTQGNVNGTLDGIFGQKRNFLFDRNIIEGSGARNPAWTKIASMNAYEFFQKKPQGYENLRGAIDELRSTSNFPEPLKDNPMTLEQYLKIASREDAKIKVAKEIKTGNFK